MTNQITSSPLFGIFLCLVCFMAASVIRKKTGSVLANPFLVASVMIIAVLLVFDIPYNDFAAGADVINIFLGPVTVILAVPLYKHRNVLNHYIYAIVGGIFSGVVAAIISVVVLARIMGMNSLIERSLVAKSITAPIGIETTKIVGGIEGITVIAIILSGLLGAVIAPFVFKVCHIKNDIAMGVGIGSASHAIGTSKALEMGEKIGATSGLTIGIAGITTVVIVSILNFFMWN
ncbi:MAG: LrgB family protein [Flavobacteriales bacterium]|nr:LrgB family protein [Flavobacteriales bacterium]